MADISELRYEGREGTPDRNNASHTRTYQACIPCRRRKVRCDLGPVDNPHDPPCVRCRREAKECFFSATRRKRRAADSGGDADDVDAEDYELQGARKRLKSNEAHDIHTPRSPVQYLAQPLTPGGSVGRLQPLRRPTGNSGMSGTPLRNEDDDDDDVDSQTAAILQTAEVHSGHDALNVLLEAATHHRAGSISSGRPIGMFEGYTSTNLPPTSSPLIARPQALDYRHPGAQGRSAIDPVIMSGATSSSSAAELSSALKAWSRFRFVRAGWFTAREGMAYVDYFYKNLCPLTPIALPNYSGLAFHETLLTDEPMLAVTILTVASRHMKLEGAGSHSRPYAIHQKLWTYLEGMINRLVWGQEQFGGGLCGAGALPGCDVNPYSRKGLRTLGTVESLMLLTEWHPRSMHFPPDENDGELMVPDGPAASPDLNDENAHATKGIGGQRLDTWLEPCWRSDRICWMLLSMAMSLAFEIGVFDEDTSRHAPEIAGFSDEKKLAFEQRRMRDKNLLLVYTTQTSGRLGLTSMLPQQYSEPSLSDAYINVNAVQTTVKDSVIHFWLRMASLMKIGNRELFKNRQYTREIIKTGRYRELLQTFQPSLIQFRKDFDACREMPTLMRHILTIEFEYCRVYLNSLGLQAVVERCTHNSPNQAFAKPARSTGSVHSAAKSDSAIPPATLEKWYGSDRFYINEVIDGSRNLLRAVVEGLCPDGFLRQAPVRTFFRVISVSIILLKTFALGATEDDVAISLGFMDRTIEALRTCIVDDVHVASRFADLLGTAVNRIRSRFVRMARSGANGVSRVASHSPAPQQTYAQSMPMNPPSNQSSLRSTAFIQQGWPYNGAGNMNGNMNGNGNGNGIGTGSASATYPNGRNTPSNPLYGISTQTYDFSDNGTSFNVMPPPMAYANNSPSLGNSASSMAGGGIGMSYNAYSSGAEFADDGSMPDWLALPLDPILNSYGADVTQTGYGPGVGEYDMLELLLGGDGMS